MSRGKGFGLKCGHCGNSVRIRTSDGAHVCLRTLFLQCTNEQCGATYRGTLEVTHQYSPSGKPNPGFELPTPSRVLKMQDRRALVALGNNNQFDLLDESAPDEDAEGFLLAENQGSAS